MNEIFNQITSLWSSFVVIIIIALAFIINKWLFNRLKWGKGTITGQLISVIIALIGALAVTITLPIDQSIKGQIISLIGLVLSAAIALSSTTIIGNALAGLMNSSIQNFKLGDFVRIENNFGRVTKKGLFRTEIQTEDRNLTSLPNLYIASHPLKIVRDSGTIISTTVSLGYDLNRSDVEKILLTAANEAGLTEQFVYIANLGDFSVTYKINGLLTDTKKYFTTSSLLNAKVMDNLHKAGIEIVSPDFMNQRQVNEAKFIPKITKPEKSDHTEKLPEEIVFDKAIEADKIEEKSQSLEKIENQITELKQSLKGSEDKDKINERINNLEKYREKLNKNIEDQKNKLDERK
jgi:small-conductance mechanosensitive channel